jgi:deoxyribonuclease-4
MLFGAHVSIAGGHANAPKNAQKIGCEVFQFFTRSPQGGKVAEITSETVLAFQKSMKENNQKECYVHAPYFINFASTNPRVYHGSTSVIRQELERASLLGAKFLMTHLGSYKDSGEKEGFAMVVDGLNKTIDGYKGETEFLIEIAAGAGEVIGATFEEIGKIIHHPKLKKYKIGVCFDTEHAFASGYDLRTEKAVENTLSEFDNSIGLDRLKMFHCNDSKVEFGAHKDRHEHIGEGFIGTGGFTALLSNKHLQDKSFILETEHDKVEEDLKILKKIRQNIS